MQARTASREDLAPATFVAASSSVQRFLPSNELNSSNIDPQRFICIWEEPAQRLERSRAAESFTADWGEGWVIISKRVNRRREVW